MITVPPPDPAYNEKIENDPRYPLACKWVYVINGVGVGLCVITVLMRYLFPLKTFGLVSVLVFVLMALMPVSILVVYFFRGLVWYNIRTTVSNPSSILGIFTGGMGLTVGAVMNSFVAYGPLFITAGWLALICWIAMLLTTSEFKALTKLDMGNIGALLFVCYVFCFGAYASSNVLFDSSEPKSYPTIITDKKMTKNRDHEKSFYLYFTPVAQIDDDDIEVHEDFYDSVDVNDSVQFKLRAGRWGNQWYYLETD